MSVIRKFLHLVTLVISSGVNSSGCVPRPSPTFAEFDPVESPSPDPIRDCCWIGAGGRWNVKLFKNLKKKTKSYRRGIWSVWPWLELVCGSYSIILNLVLVKFCFRWKNKKSLLTGTGVSSTSASVFIAALWVPLPVGCDWLVVVCGWVVGGVCPPPPGGGSIPDII